MKHFIFKNFHRLKITAAVAIKSINRYKPKTTVFLSRKAVHFFQTWKKLLKPVSSIWLVKFLEQPQWPASMRAVERKRKHKYRQGAGQECQFRAPPLQTAECRLQTAEEKSQLLEGNVSMLTLLTSFTKVRICFFFKNLVPFL